MRTILILAVLLLASCRTVPDGDKPPPEVLEVKVPTFVPIDPTYTELCKWVADASIAEIFVVAAGRKKCLEFYEANIKTIEKIEGKPVP